MAAPEDCDDTDPDISPLAPEVCGSGADEDCDGLIDCEDGDCFDECVEDCESVGDEDDDGLADCEDDDCMGVRACIIEGATFQVVSGLHVEEWWRVRSKEVQGTSGNQLERWSERFATEEHHVYSVQGELRLPALSHTCTWSIDRVSWIDFRSIDNSPRYIESTFIYGSALSRSGFVMSSGCPLQTSGFLERMYLNPNPRYSGGVLLTSVVYHQQSQSSSNTHTWLGVMYSWQYSTFQGHGLRVYSPVFGAEGDAR